MRINIQIYISDPWLGCNVRFRSSLIPCDRRFPITWSDRVIPTSTYILYTVGQLSIGLANNQIRYSQFIYFKNECFKKIWFLRTLLSFLALMLPAICKITNYKMYQCEYVVSLYDWPYAAVNVFHSLKYGPFCTLLLYSFISCFPVLYFY